MLLGHLFELWLEDWLTMQFWETGGHLRLMNLDITNRMLNKYTNKIILFYKCEIPCIRTFRFPKFVAFLHYRCCERRGLMHTTLCGKLGERKGAVNIHRLDGNGSWRILVVIIKIITDPPQRSSTFFILMVATFSSFCDPLW